MKERGIIFSGPMVKALLAGAKTQTRRMYKMRRTDNVGATGGPLFALPSPYGAPGDRLWVRETWTHDADSLDDARSQHEDALSASSVYYRASTPDDEAETFARWRSPIHMPRWASRITLELTEVRVQRLQSISEADARAEGVDPYRCVAHEQRVPGPGFDGVRLGDQPHRLPFADLWDKINGDGAWDANPWVWALTFRRIT